jgi:FixJ family two-component response regulator
VTIEWPSKVNILLGIVPDRVIAAKMGISVVTVGNRRSQLGISAFGNNAGFQWTPEMDALLGTATDRKVADQLGICGRTVRLRRYELEIPSCRARSSFAALVWMPERDVLLGTASDREVAEQLDISKFHVRRRRRQLGIPSWAEQNRVLPKGVERWTSEANHIHRARRKHREAGLANTLTYKQWLFACEWFDNRCAYCGQETFLTEDHLVPVKQGGPRTLLNIVPACLQCNQSKGPRKAHLWIYWKFGRAEGKEIADRIVRYLTEVSSP